LWQGQTKGYEPLNYAMIYHRYNLDPRYRKVWEDPVSPVLASIATLRNVNKSIKVFVLDTEPFLEDWSDYPSLLDFHVVQQPIQIPLRYEEGCAFQTRMLSRPWDVWEFSSMIPETGILYSDSDVFWLKDPIPFERPLDHIQGDYRGDGYFAYNKTSHAVEVFFNLWKALTLGGILDEGMRVKMRLSGYHSSMFMAEMCYCYLIRNGFAPCWSALGPLEHYYPTTQDQPINLDAKCLHAHSGLFGSDRLRVARSVREFNRAIRSVLPEREADRLLGGVVADVDLGDIKRLRA
jgi:hypothetical protein